MAAAALTTGLAACDGRDMKALPGMRPEALATLKEQVRERAGDPDATFQQLRRDPRTGFVCGRMYHGLLRTRERFVFAARPIVEFGTAPQAFAEAWHSFCE
jgi:hypothetical protein